MFETKSNRKPIFLIFLLAVIVILGFMFVLPPYGVWQKTLLGKAHLKQAEFNRQIQVVEAEAKAHAAKSLAEAEVTRAGGVARANEIIGQSLKNNEAYLRYLWIDSLSHTNDKVIYVPTEAGLPILEANRFNLGNK